MWPKRISISSHSVFPAIAVLCARECGMCDVWGIWVGGVVSSDVWVGLSVCVLFFLCLWLVIKSSYLHETGALVGPFPRVPTAALAEGKRSAVLDSRRPPNTLLFASSCFKHIHKIERSTERTGR